MPFSIASFPDSRVEAEEAKIIVGDKKKTYNEPMLGHGPTSWPKTSTLGCYSNIKETFIFEDSKILGLFI